MPHCPTMTEAVSCKTNRAGMRSPSSETLANSWLVSGTTRSYGVEFTYKKLKRSKVLADFTVAQISSCSDDRVLAKKSV